MQGEVIDSVIKMNIRISVSRSAHPVSTQSYVAFRSLSWPDSICRQAE